MWWNHDNFSFYVLNNQERFAASRSGDIVKHRGSGLAVIATPFVFRFIIYICDVSQFTEAHRLNLLLPGCLMVCLCVVCLMYE